MARIPERLPFALSERTSSISSVLLARGGQEIDIAVGGIPFRLATYSELPESMETVSVRKDQLDTEQEPGEQSLGFWWRRSQDSWHEGAGNLYQEGRGDIVPQNSFYDSRGVDVWTKGQVKLLRTMVQGNGSNPSSMFRCATYLDSGTEKASALTAASLYTTDAPENAFTALHTPGTTLVDGFISNGTFYDVATDGTLYEGLVSSPGTATTWPLTVTDGAPTRLAWGKARLWVIGGRNLWQPDLSLAAGSAQDPIFTHPNKGWAYTAIAEGPRSMYFAGHDGRTSSIQAVTLDADGGLPVLSAAADTAILPTGELVQEIAVLAGQYIGIGTNKGFRVGLIEDERITYGPLLFTPSGVTACTSIATQDRFFLVGFNDGGNAEIYKVDTSTQISEGVYPYAKDVEAGTTAYPTSLAILGTQVLMTLSNGDFWYQSSSDLVTSGYLQTGRIRFRTTEDKLFKSVSVEIDPLAGGSLVIDGVEETGTSFDIATFNTVGEIADSSFSLPSALGPQRQVGLKFTLARDGSDATLGPVLHSYVVRALPSVKPQREYTLPLLCFDREKGRSGQIYGAPNYAKERLAALSALEDIGDVVTFQDFSPPTPLGESVVIQSIQYVQTAPSKFPGAGGAGGILILKLRTASV